MNYIRYLMNRLYFRLKGWPKNDKGNFFECIWCKKIFKDNKKHRKIDKNLNFCSKKCKEQFFEDRYQLFKRNNVCRIHKFEKRTYKGICWGCYKQKFLNKLKSFKFKQGWLIKLKGFKFIPTFRLSSENWAGSKTAFEQYLVDHKIKYFVYIKFYKNRKGRIKPIVVGKSGSRLVNPSGSDVNFSTDIADGPARHVIKATKSSWFYQAIAIKECSNEKQAYRIESKMQEDLDLLGS